MQVTIARPTNSPKSTMSDMYMIIPHREGAAVMYARTRAEAETIKNRLQNGPTFKKIGCR